MYIVCHWYKLGGAIDFLEVIEILIECWVITSHLKFNKCWLLHLGCYNPGCAYRLRDKRVECNYAERGLGVLVDSLLNRSKRCLVVAKRANDILGCIKHSIANWSKEVIDPLYSVFVQPILSTMCRFGLQNIRKI